MKSKLLVTALFLGLFIPNVVFAAWWNPFTWKIFKKIQKTEVVVEKEAATTEKITKVEQPKIQNTAKSGDSEINFLKKQIEELSKKVSQTSTEEKQKNSVITLPSGAVVEIDTSGNIIRTIKESSQQAYTIPAPSPQTQIQATPQVQSQATSSPPFLVPESKIIFYVSKIGSDEANLLTNTPLNAHTLSLVVPQWTWNTSSQQTESCYKIAAENYPRCADWTSTTIMNLTKEIIIAEKNVDGNYSYKIRLNPSPTGLDGTLGYILYPLLQNNEKIGAFKFRIFTSDGDKLESNEVLVTNANWSGYFYPQFFKLSM